MQEKLITVYVKLKKIKLDIIKALIEGREEGVQSQILNKNRSKYFATMPN